MHSSGDAEASHTEKFTSALSAIAFCQSESEKLKSDHVVTFSITTYNSWVVLGGLDMIRVVL